MCCICFMSIIGVKRSQRFMRRRLRGQGPGYRVSSILRLVDDPKSTVNSSSPNIHPLGLTLVQLTTRLKQGSMKLGVGFPRAVLRSLEHFDTGSKSSESTDETKRER